MDNQSLGGLGAMLEVGREDLAERIDLPRH